MITVIGLRYAAFAVALLMSIGAIPAGALNAFEVAPSTTVAGAAAIYNITLNISTTSENMTNITIVFPAGFNISIASVTSSAAIPSLGATNITDQNLTYSFDSTYIGEGGNLSLGISGILNPQSVGSYSLYALTFNESSPVLDDGNSSSLGISPSTIAFVSVAFLTTTPTAGVNFTGNFSSTDAYGNEVGDTYNFTTSDAQGALPANGTSNGTEASFELRTSGAMLLSVFSNSNSSATAATVLDVGPGNPMHISKFDAPMIVTANETFPVNLTAKDEFGNELYSAFIFDSSDPLAALPLNSTLENGTNVGDFRLLSAGNHTLTAISVGNELAYNSTNVTVLIAPISRLVLTPFASSVTAGGSVQFNVSITDAFGNVNYTVNATYNVTAISGSGTINSATGLFTAVSAGIITIGVNYSNIWNQTNVTINAAATPTPTTAPSSSSSNVGPSSPQATPSPTPLITPSPTPSIIARNPVDDQGPIISPTPGRPISTPTSNPTNPGRQNLVGQALNPPGSGASSASDYSVFIIFGALLLVGGYIYLLSQSGGHRKLLRP